MSQELLFQIPTGSGDIGGGELGGIPKTWKTLRVERSGSNLVGRKSTIPRYMIDKVGTDPLSSG